MNTSRSGLTLLEAVIATTILGGVLALAFDSFSATAQVAAVTSSLTDARLEAERLVKMVRLELSTSGVGNPGRLAVKDTDPTDPEVEVEYVTLDMSAPLFDAADPYSPPFEADRRVIKFEPSGAEVLDNGTDDDGDRLVDEGQLVLYRRGALDTPIAVLGADVADFDIVVDTTANPYPRVWVTVTVERLVPGALDASGQPSKVRHVAQTMITLLN